MDNNWKPEEQDYYYLYLEDGNTSGMKTQLQYLEGDELANLEKLIAYLDQQTEREA